MLASLLLASIKSTSTLKNSLHYLLPGLAWYFRISEKVSGQFVPNKIVQVHCISQTNIGRYLVLESLNLFSNWQDSDAQIFFSFLFFFGISYIKTHKP